MSVKLSELREVAAKNIAKLSWQEVADSPTARFYTDWRAFEALLAKGREEPLFSRPEGYWDAVLGPCGEHGDETSTFSSLIKPLDNKLAAAHYANLRDDAFSLLRLRDGSISVALCEPHGDSWVSQHVVVEVPPKVRAELLLADLRAAPGSTVIEVFIGRGAQLSLLLISIPKTEGPVAHIVRKRLEEEASLNAGMLASGTLMHRVEDDAVLAGSGSRYYYRGVTVGRGREWVDYVVNMVQLGAKTRAEAKASGVALDGSKVVARGVAKVAESARGAFSLFEADVMILGERAVGYTAPMMEIDTGDVEFATHHAAAFREPEDIIFYMASRGLSPSEAVSLIVNSRIGMVVEQLKDERLRNVAAQLASNLLHTHAPEGRR
ncbi:MAG: SufD family Fe-S cluster assembly protein [Thermoproteota archaeon]